MATTHMAKLRALLVGATGIAGQQFVSALRDHPWFEIGAIAASPRNAGKRYDEAVAGGWFLPEPIPAEVAALRAPGPRARRPAAWTWSSRRWSRTWRASSSRGSPPTLPVISAASTFRMEPDVPLLIPPVNAGHVGLLAAQRRAAAGAGYVAPIPNCTTTGLAVALAPLAERFGVRLGDHDLAAGGVRRRPLARRGRARRPGQRHPLHRQGGGEGRGGDAEDPRPLGARGARGRAARGQGLRHLHPGRGARTGTPRRSPWRSAGRRASTR